MKKTKRLTDIVIISDVHPGTYGCHAKELLHYLKAIQPGTIVVILSGASKIILNVQKVISRGLVSFILISILKNVS